MPSVPLLKALAGAGIGSRRWLADAIRNGLVEINGRVAEGFNQPVNVEKDRVLVNGRLVNLKPQKTVYLMLHKPEGILSTTSDDRERRTIIDMLPPKYRRLKIHPVGRLDKNSSGCIRAPLLSGGS